MDSRHRLRGQALVESVLALMIALALIFGIVDFGRAIYTYDTVASAARVGSRYAIVHGSACTVTGCPTTSAAIQTYVRSQVTGVSASSLAVTTTWVAAPGCSTSPYQGPLCLVKVQVQYPFSFMLSFHKTMTMTAISQMIVSQ